LDRSGQQSVVQTSPHGCLHLPLHPFLSPLGAQCPPCHPSQEAMALLRPHQPPSPWGEAREGGSFQKGYRRCQLRVRLASALAGSTYLSPALPRTHVRPCAEAAAEKHVLAFQSDRGKLEDENVKGRWDLRPRNCLARFALCEGGEHPGERSARAFPRSWKSVTVCVGKVGFWVCFFFIFDFFCQRRSRC